MSEVPLYLFGVEGLRTRDQGSGVRDERSGTKVHVEVGINECLLSSALLSLQVLEGPWALSC